MMSANDYQEDVGVNCHYWRYASVCCAQGRIDSL